MENEDQVIDQIGELLMSLPPEKQMQVMAKLQELMGDKPMAPDVVSPEGGPNGRPVGV